MIKAKYNIILVPNLLGQMMAVRELLVNQLSHSMLRYFFLPANHFCKYNNAQDVYQSSDTVRTVKRICYIFL